jgi:sec-independent protein translocase protein TatB
MLDIGWSELLVLAIVAIVVVGPKDLPKMMRTVGFYAGKGRRMAADFRRQFHEVVAESEAEEVRKNLEAIKANMGRAPDLNQPIGKPLMTGPPVAPETNFVEPPAANGGEPSLPEPRSDTPAGQRQRRNQLARSMPPRRRPRRSVHPPEGSRPRTSPLRRYLKTASRSCERRQRHQPEQGPAHRSSD